MSVCLVGGAWLIAFVPFALDANPECRGFMANSRIRPQFQKDTQTFPKKERDGITEERRQAGCTRQGGTSAGMAVGAAGAAKQSTTRREGYHAAHIVCRFEEKERECVCVSELVSAHVPLPSFFLSFFLCLSVACWTCVLARQL